MRGGRTARPGPCRAAHGRGGGRSCPSWSAVLRYFMCRDTVAGRMMSVLARQTSPGARKATVDEQRLSGDVRRGIRDQEGGRGRDLYDLAQAPGRDLRLGGLLR